MQGVTGIVLAGGQGRRMGGIDKGLQLLDGRPLVAWAITRLAPQVAAIIVNANQNLEAYGALGYPVVRDAVGDFAGPLAGLHAGLQATRTALAVSVPCDSPFLPADLVARLRSALAANDADLAVAKTGAQPHPVFSLVQRRVLPHLEAFLQSGGRKIDAWYASLNVIEVSFDDQVDAFSNINTRAELAGFEGQPTGRR